MIAVYGCYFPDPAHANYDTLLQDCLERLAPYAETEYVIVFFAQPMEHEPKLSWMYKAYRSLERKYKKNIKKLYVTHPSKWFKLIIWIMSRILSNKFAAKIEPVDSLEELEKMIPLERVFVPPVVSGHDRHLSPIPQGENANLLPAVRIFGAEVERAVPSGEVPSQIEKVVRHLAESGLKEEGLFRLSPDTEQVEQIRISMDRDYDIDLGQFSPHALASALKAYFRHLPTPLIPPVVYKDFGGLFGTPLAEHGRLKPIIDLSSDKERCSYIKRSILNKMSDQRRALLGLIIRLLRKTANNYEENKMHPRNLAAVWTPNLVRCESLEEEMRMLATSQKFIEVMIDLSDDLFGTD